MDVLLIAGVAGLFAIGSLVALVLVSKSLGKAERQLTDSERQRSLDLDRFREFQDLMSEDVSDISSEAMRELIRARRLK